MRGPGGRIELPREDVIRAYDEGSSFMMLGAKYGVSRVTISRRLHQWGANIRPSSNSSGKAVDNGGNNGGDPYRSQMLELEEKIVEEERNLQLAYDHKRELEQALVVLKAAAMRRLFK